MTVESTQRLLLKIVKKHYTRKAISQKKRRPIFLNLNFVIECKQKIDFFTAMKCLVFEEFIRLFPQLDLAGIQEVYQLPFDPKRILECFEGWQFFELYNRFVDSSEDSNMVWFEENRYHLNEQLLHNPVTLNDFIADCLRLKIVLRWTEQLADQLFASHALAV